MENLYESLTTLKYPPTHSNLRSLKSNYAKVLDEIINLLSIELYNAMGVGSGERLVVIGVREGAVNLYSYTKGSLVKLNREPVSGAARVPHGSDKVVFIRDVAHGKEQHLIYTVDLDSPGEEKPLKEMKPMRIMGLTYDDDKIVFTGATMSENALFTAKDKVEKKATLPGFASVMDVNGKLAAGIGVLEPATGKFQAFIADLESGDIKVYKHPEGSVSITRFHPEGYLIVGVEGPSVAKLLKLDPETLNAEELELPKTDLEDYKPRSFNYVGILPGDKIVIVGRKNGRSKVFIDGGEINVPDGIHGGVFSWNGKLVLTHTSLRDPSRIIDSEGNTVLSGEVPEYVRDSIGNVFFQWIDSFDGEKVPTFIIESNRAGRPGPTIVLVHGGPFSEDADMWDIFTASLVLAGFNVVKPNYRGSTGYGENWRLKIIGDPCGDELEDIIHTSKWAKNTGLASQTYIMGYSYGGYMTMCALTRKPGFYNGGVAGASVTDWEEMYELSDAALKTFIHMLFGGRRNLLAERSPVKYIDNLRDPLMIIHPQNDSRTPLKPVLHFMEKALEKNKTFEAYIAPGMGHAINRVEDVLKILYPAIIFLLRLKQS